MLALVRTIAICALLQCDLSPLRIIPLASLLLYSCFLISWGRTYRADGVSRGTIFEAVQRITSCPRSGNLKSLGNLVNGEKPPYSSKTWMQIFGDCCQGSQTG
jgi:hypothetical protein